MLTGPMGLKKVRITNYKNIFGKCYTPNWSEEMFVILRVKTTVPWTYVISLEFRVQSLELRKYSREKVKNYMLNRKAMIFLSMVGLIKKDTM